MIDRLLNLPLIKQKTEEWFQARHGCISASDVASALKQTEAVTWHYIASFRNVAGFSFTPKPNSSCNPYSRKLDLIKKKCNLGPPFTGNQFTNFGQKYEQVASNIYSQITGSKVHEFGLIVHPKYQFIGASPDGITQEGVMLEIKCPSARDVHPYPPLHYYLQMMIQMECTGLLSCDYLDCRFIEFTDAEVWESEARRDTDHFYGIINQGCDGDWEYASLGTKTPDEYLAFSRPGCSYYKLEKFFTTRVEYDQTWFAGVLPDLRAVWEEIEMYRSNSELQESLVSKPKGAGKVLYMDTSTVEVVDKYKALFTY